MKIAFVIVFFVCLVVQGLAQKYSGASLDPSKPTVFLEFVSRTRERITQEEFEPERLWFRLHNNGRSGIRVDTSGGIDRDRHDVTLYYDIVDSDEKVLDRLSCHVCSTIILSSGKSLIFNVPADRLYKTSLLRLNFSYEWESDLGVARGVEPKHFVFFPYENLPQGMLKE